MFTYRCPNCQQPLALNERSFRCNNLHSFDIAKEGYVNLMLVQKKKSKNPGDSKDMLKCRQRFLNQGFYSKLVDKLAETIQQHGPDTHLNMIDIGCGEGFYSHSLAQHPALKPLNMELAGLDISKVGVQMAAKRKFGLQAAVASAFDIPFFENSFDVALSVFSPICPLETARILKPGGLLIFVGPGEKHLQGLSEKIYSTTQKHQGNKAPLEQSPHFKLIDKLNVNEHATIEQPYLLDLLKMTPYYWQCTPEQQQLFSELVCIETPIEFTIEIFYLDSTVSVTGPASGTTHTSIYGSRSHTPPAEDR